MKVIFRAVLIFLFAFKISAGEIMILSASSLTDGLKRAVNEFQIKFPKVKFSLNFSSSGAMRNQIENGAPADLFLSADIKQISKLQEMKVVDSRNIFLWLSNELIVIAPLKASKFSFNTLPLLKGKIAIGKPGVVPVGTYAKESLVALNIFSLIEENLVFANSTRQVASYILSENCDAGIVYASDYFIFRDRVQFIEKLPQESYQKICYGIANLSPQKNEVKEFILFLLSNQGKEIFENYGFSSY